jgi:ATP-dependent DNA helicase RecG
MAINLVSVSKDDVGKVLNLDESHFVDVKSIDIAPGKLTSTAAAIR